MSGSTLNETVQYRWKRLQQIEVEIKLKYKSGKNWGTLTTDRWLQGDRLIQVRLYLQDKFIHILIITITFPWLKQQYAHCNIVGVEMKCCLS